MRRAMGFLTVLGGASPPRPDAVLWFPIVGALLGLAVGGVWVGAGHAWPIVVAAAVAVTADALLTGGLHYDGLADTGDGLLPALSSERRLAAMTDPHVGAFGLLALVLVGLLRFAALAGGPAKVWIVAALWCASRAAAAVVLLVGRYARAEGLATAFRDAGSARLRAAVVIVVGLVVSVPLAIVDRPGHGLAALGAAVVVAVGLVGVAHRRLGGYTGDVLGAGIVLGETAGLLVWSARW
jgi:adenosylcobinamide-GDP ribazoletransferase